MATIDARVAAATDDASEIGNGNVATNAVSFNIDEAGEWIGFRVSVTIPDGATIDAAYLVCEFDSGTLDEPDLTIYGEDTATPAVFAAGTGTFSISGRSRTTASVNWGSTDLGGPGTFNSPSIVSIINELMGSYSYASGAYMSMLLTSRAGDTNRDARIVLYDGSTTTCPLLHIEYTEAGGGNTYAMTATLTAVSDTNAPNTGVARPSSSTLTAISDTNAPLLSIARPLAATQTAASDTNAPLLAVTRPFAATLTAVSSTDAIAITAIRVLSATLTAVSNTDGALLSVARPMRFDDAVAGSGGVAQGLLLALTQTLTASGGGPHAISNTDAIALNTSGVWALSATLAAISDTNAPLLSITRPMAATLTAISNTGDVLLQVARALSAILTAISDTGSIEITVQTAGEIAMSAVLGALSSTNAPLLAVARPSASILTAVSNTDAVLLAVARALAATLTAQSDTNAIAFTRGLAFTSTLTAQTDTTALQLAIARQLSAVLTAQSNTDAALVAVARSLASTLTAQSSTSDISLIAAMIVGLISASFAIRQPGADFASKQPSGNFSARPPTVTFTTRE